MLSNASTVHLLVIHVKPHCWSVHAEHAVHPNQNVFVTSVHT